jgi:hypothetical protein
MIVDACVCVCHVCCHHDVCLRVCVSDHLSGVGGEFSGSGGRKQRSGEVRKTHDEEVSAYDVYV